MGKRNSQDGNDVRVYSFRLDRRKERDNEARQILDQYLSQEGTSLRDLMIHWLLVNDREWVVIGDRAIGQEIRAVMNEFRSQFFVEFLEFMRANNIEALRNFVSDESVESSSPLDRGFVDSMMNLFDGGK